VGFDFSLNTSGLDVIGFFFEGLVVAISARLPARRSRARRRASS